MIQAPENDGTGEKEKDVNDIVTKLLRLKF